MRAIALKEITICAPVSFHFIPELQSRCLIKVLHAASVTPEPIGKWGSVREAVTKPKLAWLFFKKFIQINKLLSILPSDVEARAVK